MLYIGADHGGYKLKEYIKKYLTKEKLKFTDVGANSLKPTDDYVDYAKKVGQKVSAKPDHVLGLLICRSGQGMAITANKFKNVRASLVWNVGEAKASRNDDMANVLCLPSDHVSTTDVLPILETWLQTPYSTEVRHVRRVSKITKLEKGL